MTTEHLEQMGLDPERVEARIDFLLAYANSITQHSVEEAVDEPVQMLSPSSRPADRWTQLADAATALREAGQWSLFTNELRALELLRAASDHYIALGLGFGLYLDAVAPDLDAPGRTDPGERLPLLAEALRVMASGDWSSEAASFVATPPQQAYTLCAAAATPMIVQEHGDLLEQVIEGSLHRAGVIPVGALDTPIHRFWAVARVLFRGALDEDTLVAHLGAMAVRYGETMELAQINSYLWTNCAAPVDVGDIDTGGLEILATQRLGPTFMMHITNQIAERVGALAISPLEIGLETAQHIPRPPDTPRYTMGP